MTVLTLAGALGIGPGALAQSSPSAPAGSTSSGPSAQSAGRSPSAHSKSHSNGDGWVTVQRTPVGPRQPATPSSGPSGSPAASATDLPARSGHGKRIVYDISSQRVWLVDKHDAVARTYLASGSKKAKVLAPGRYQVISRSRHSMSADGKQAMNYLVRFGDGKHGDGKHAVTAFSDIPARSDGTLVESQSQLGTPLSTDSVRQWITDAKALWDFASVGMPVVVTA